MRVALAVVLVLFCAHPALAQDDDAKEEARLLKKARRLAEDGENAEAYKTFVEVAALARNREHTETAITALDEARAVAPSEPDEARLLSQIGHLWMTQGEHPKSVKAYRRAVKLVPEFAPYWNSLGYSLHLAGSEEESVAAFEKCIELDSQNREARYSLGVAARLSGKPLKALRQHERLVEAGKKGGLTVPWFFAWESAQAKEKSKGLELASAQARLVLCELEVAIDHVFLDELGNAEEALAKVADTDKDELGPALEIAIDEVSRALELRPQHLQLHWLAGQLWRMKGEKAKAKDELEKFVAAEKALRPFVKKVREELSGEEPAPKGK